MSYVVCKLSKAGLGNQLFPLLHAMVFAKINNLPIVITGYNHVKIGPYLRKEKSKRNYTGYFNFQKNIFFEFIDRFKLFLISSNYQKINEPIIEVLPANDLDKKIFIFQAMPTYHDYFGKLMQYRLLVKEIFSLILKDNIKKRIATHPNPLVGVHIRMGDFRQLNATEVFKGGHVRAPEDYYINIIEGIRQINGNNLAVSIFTDGYLHEFKKINQLPAISFVETGLDIVDLILLSKSKLIVMSPGSTFSAWAAFLSDSPVIKFTDKDKPLRPSDIRDKIYEGMFSLQQNLLKENIRDIYE